jgi:hypothetical protein
MAALLPVSLLAQSSGVLTVSPVERVRAKRNETATVKLHLQIQPGYHANSNTPNDDFLIPMKLTWAADPLKVENVEFPKPKSETYPFSEKPVSVFSGEFDIVTRFKVPANAAGGPALGTGKLRYQACNEKMCLPPKTIEVPLTIEIQ